MAELETLFSRPGEFEDHAQLASAGERYRVLKEEAGSLWEEWERLSVEAESIDSKLEALQPR